MNDTKKLLEIRLLVDQKVIEETLTRMGIVDKKKKIIYQSCHLLKHFNSYYLAHFKQLFVLSTGKNGFPGFGNVSMEDMQRRNSIANWLIKWGMIEIIGDPNEIEPHNAKIEIIPYKEKKEYKIIKKFNVENLNNDFC